MTGVVVGDSAELARQQRIILVFEAQYGDMMKAHGDAWRTKFRMMSATPLAFYRGSAVLFYSDLADDVDPLLNAESSRVWIHGDLHAENFGTYLDSAGRLLFDVIDFDEAYVGPFTWDLRRLAVSMALIGYGKALADDEIRILITALGESYVRQVERFGAGEDDKRFAITLDNATGVVLDVLQTARQMTRVALLDSATDIVDGDRRFRRDSHRTTISDEMRTKLERVFVDYLASIPDRKRLSAMNYRIKDVTTVQGYGIGSVGLRAYTMLLEGPTQTLENDIIVWFKEALPSAVACGVKDERIGSYFHHDGHRTAVSQRALQVNADPWLGYAELDGAGMFVMELPPYEASVRWGEINHFEEFYALAKDFGRVVAKIHCVSDEDSDHSLVPGSADQAILSSVLGNEDVFVEALANWSEAYASKCARITNCSWTPSATGSFRACDRSRACPPPRVRTSGRIRGMRMSAKAEYAVRAMTQLASVPAGELVTTDEIAKSQGIPPQFLVDILGELRADRLVRSHRGRDGGYQLARPAEKISIADVLRCIDGPLASVRDIGLGDLPYAGPTAALTDVWRALRASMRSVLEETTLADVASGVLPAHVDRMARDYITQEDGRGRQSS